MDDYITLNERAQIEIDVKHSRFIAVAAPVTTEEQAVALIAEQRSLHPTANHHVYAYRLREGNRVRYSDDGEPAKTAGLPTLAMLEGRKVVDAVVVVIRYFGGTLLGTGGLVRAYGDGARLAIEKAGLKERIITTKLELTVEYSMYEKICHLLNAQGATVVNCVYDDKTTLTITIASINLDELLNEITRVGNGRLTPKVIETLYC